MTPEEIEARYGKEALDMLYDCILDMPAHELADWILSYQKERAMARWIKDLKKTLEDES
jgi:hypothetical protein